MFYTTEHKRKPNPLFVPPPTHECSLSPMSPRDSTQKGENMGFGFAPYKAKELKPKAYESDIDVPGTLVDMNRGVVFTPSVPTISPIESRKEFNMETNHGITTSVPTAPLPPVNDPKPRAVNTQNTYNVETAPNLFFVYAIKWYDEDRLYDDCGIVTGASYEDCFNKLKEVYGCENDIQKINIAKLDCPYDTELFSVSDNECLSEGAKNNLKAVIEELV